MRARELLQSAITFHEAPRRTNDVPSQFTSAKEAIRIMTDVLLHEARESMQDPLLSRPAQPYLHPVDVNTSEPGIVSSKTSIEIMRVCADDVPRFGYHNCETVPTEEREDVITVQRSKRAADRDAERKVKSAIRKGERGAQTEERIRERKRERDAETPDVRERRLQEQREKRERVKRERNERGESPGAEQRQETTNRKTKAVRECDPFPDTSMANVVARHSATPTRVRGMEHFYQHPLPHHRHLTALRHVSPHTSICAALLRAETSDALEIIQGPPGTGKTTQLVECLTRLTGRVLLCAPTNVGASNLYERCVQCGYAAECALSVAPDRIPPGTAVQSNDASRRIVCATISSRGGPTLDEQSFDSVLVDEAAQCMEAWTWTLFRPEVTFVALAGDVHQLPALVSETGQSINHGRSLMERLITQGYDNVTSLTVQNRMCPQILELVNHKYYEGTLTCGQHAPTSGTVQTITVEGREVQDGTSYYNIDEVDMVQKICETLDPATTVIICPYMAQCRRILARGIGVAVHTIDSFQGREADNVIVSTVRDGSSGMGFWSDPRRRVVAYTRARLSLYLVASG